MGMMPPAPLIRCPAFIGKDGRSTARVAVHSAPCEYAHPYEDGWTQAGIPDASTMEEYRKAHPVLRASESAQQRLMNEIFGPDDDDDEVNNAEGSSRKIPKWKDFFPDTVNANLEMLNSALASIDYPTLEVEMDNTVPDVGPSVSFSSSGGYVYPQELQYSRPVPKNWTAAGIWTEIERNAKKQWDEAHGKVQTRVAGVVSGHTIQRPIINTGGPVVPPGPGSPLMPRSPVDKRKRDDFGIKFEGSTPVFAPTAKRPRRDDPEELGPSLGELLLQWRSVLQVMVDDDRREEATWEKMKEISKIVERIEESKDDISREALGRFPDRGGTKLGLTIRRLGSVEYLPYEATFHVKQRAQDLTLYWNTKFGAQPGEGV